MDPLATRFLGTYTDGNGHSVKDPGAYSIYLWKAGEAPLN